MVNTTGDHMQRGEFVWTVNHVMSIQLDPKLVSVGAQLWGDRQGRAARGGGWGEGWCGRLGLLWQAHLLLAHPTPPLAPLPSPQVDILFYLFADDQGRLNIQVGAATLRAARGGV